MKWKPTCAALTLAAAIMAGGAGPLSAEPRWQIGDQNNYQGRHDDRNDDRENRRRERRSDQEHAREAVREGKILPLGRVLGTVQRAYPGRLLDAELVDGGGRPVYLIKMMTRDGIALISADAVTGRVLGYRQGGR
ncbi:MAG TPA: PepSY domain-containing protein [Parvibaculum sp.]